MGRNGNSRWRAFYQVLELETLFYSKEDMSTFKVRSHFCWSQSQKSLTKVTRKRKHFVLRRCKIPNSLLPALFLTLITLQGYQLKLYILISVLFMGARADWLLGSSPQSYSHPLLMKNRKRWGREEQRPWKTPSFLPCSFGATAKRISKPIQLKQLWKCRTACTLPPHL